MITSCSLAWLKHQSGGLGIAGSNPVSSTEGRLNRKRWPSRKKDLVGLLKAVPLNRSVAKWYRVRFGTCINCPVPFASLEEKQKYQRKHYAKNQKRYLARKKKCRAAVYQRLKAIVIEAKKDGCMDCKQEFRHWVLQFDHVRGKKLHNVANLIGASPSEERLRAEIAKCEVVCANCHADRTYQRGMA